MLTFFLNEVAGWPPQVLNKTIKAIILNAKLYIVIVLVSKVVWYMVILLAQISIRSLLFHMIQVT